MTREIVDAHAYIGSDYHTYFHQSGEYSVERYINEMNRFGVHQAVLIPGGIAAEVEINYGKILHAIDKYPDRLYGFYRIQPRAKRADELVNAALAAGMKGIMLHPHWDTFVANSKVVDPIMDVVKQWNVPVLFYCGDIPYSMPGQIADVAVRYPCVPVIIGHMAKTEVYQHVVQSALRSPNIFVETSGCGILTIIEDAVSKLGASRVLFGSGWPGMSIPAEICKIESLKINENEKDTIFGGIKSLLKTPE